jgi:Xaa-Pro aminopeptidase
MDALHRYPTFSEGEMAERLSRTRARMDELDLGALLVYGAGRAPDVQYLSNWPGTRESILVVPRHGELALLVQLYNHVPNARRIATVSDVRWIGPRLAETIASRLAGVALREGAIGLAGAWPSRHVDALKTRLHQVAFVDATHIIRDLRLRKSRDELGWLRLAARLTDAAMRALEQEVRPGMREFELAAIVEGAYLRHGGLNAIHFMATTPMDDLEVGVPSQIPSSRLIERGDVLITEIGAEYWGYAGQIHRAYAIAADPTPEYARLHDVACEAFERIRDTLRDGATVADVLDAAELIHRHGLTVYDDLLHGVDQLPPVLQTRRTARAPQPEAFVFRENMVVVVQPNVVRDPSGSMGLQVGETVRIARDGVERLHRYPLRFTRVG